MILGGRVAEELIYGKDNVTTGASNDLEKVSNLARSMVTTYGMSEKWVILLTAKIRNMYLWVEISVIQEIF